MTLTLSLTDIMDKKTNSLKNDCVTHLPADCHNDFKTNALSIYETQLRFVIGGKKHHWNKQLSVSSNNSHSRQHKPCLQ